MWYLLWFRLAWVGQQLSLRTVCRRSRMRTSSMVCIRVLCMSSGHTMSWCWQVASITSSSLTRCVFVLLLFTYFHSRLVCTHDQRLHTLVNSTDCYNWRNRAGANYRMFTRESESWMLLVMSALCQNWRTSTGYRQLHALYICGKWCKIETIQRKWCMTVE